jgi:tetratricopeptide (TPR) repeat protein
MVVGQTNVALAQAELFGGLAIKFAPELPEAWWGQATVWEAKENLAEALKAMEKAGQWSPPHPDFWDAWGAMLEKTNRLEEAYAAYSKAVELAAGNTNQFEKNLSKTLLNRSALLRRQNRIEEAKADMLGAKNILQETKADWVPTFRLNRRDPQTKPNLIDLSAYYRFQIDNRRFGAAKTVAANWCSVGKGVALGHPLPVVAMESIPHIYRRASFSLRATPPSLPRQGKTRRLFLMSRLSQFQQKLSRLIRPSCASFALTSR